MWRFVLFKEHLTFATLLQFVAEFFVLVSGAVWTRDPLPSDECDSFWEPWCMTEVLNKLYGEIEYEFVCTV